MDKVQQDNSEENVNKESSINSNQSEKSDYLITMGSDGIMSLLTREEFEKIVKMARELEAKERAKMQARREAKLKNQAYKEDNN